MDPPPEVQDRVIAADEFGVAVSAVGLGGGGVVLTSAAAMAWISAEERDPNEFICATELMAAVIWAAVLFFFVEVASGLWQEAHFEP